MADIAGMKDIQEYLAIPDTHRLYAMGLELLVKYGLPTYQHQYTILARGPLGNNRENLEQILRAIQKQGVIAAPQPEAASINVIAPRAEIATSTNTEVQLLLELRRMRMERAKISQMFHSCDTDEERALICSRIEAQNQLITKQEGIVAYFQRHGKLPEEADDAEDTPLPDDKEELALMRNRCSSSILKVEKRIEHLLSLPETSKKRAQLPGQQKKLERLAARRLAIRNKQKAMKNGKTEKD